MQKNSLYNLIKEWLLNHRSIRSSYDHFNDFWFIWEILLSLALGLVLLYPGFDGIIIRFLLIGLITCILWNPLKAICGQSKKGKVIFVLIIITILAFLLHWSMQLNPQNWIISHWWCRIMLIGLTLLLILRPMNAVYGLMGTGGSIRIFFFNYVLISLIFSTIYYFGFFKDAGISYDVNQPHIDYQLFANNEKEDTAIVSEKRDTMFLEHQLDTVSFKESVVHVSIDTLHYQSIEFEQVWRSTIMTTLTQEPTDLLNIATVHNEAMESTNVGLDKEKSELFEWILIFHIIISWIFFGVFISLLYNKFRYES